MTQTKSPQRPRKAPTRAGKATTEPRPKRPWLSWAAFIIPAAALVTVVAFGGGEPTDGQGDVGAAAPAFDLPATDGANYTLDAVLTDGPALLYFSMGPGCDGCFAQIPEIQDTLTEEGITLVSVMVDPATLVAAEAQRFGITTPILIDADRSVSEAYGMIGIYGHSDRPSHSFALVDADGSITASKHYAEMFVPTDLGIAS